MKRLAVLRIAVLAVAVAGPTGCIVEDRHERREDRREERHEERRDHDEGHWRTCPKCGARVEVGVRVCGSCGVEIR